MAWDVACTRPWVWVPALGGGRERGKEGERDRCNLKRILKVKIEMYLVYHSFEDLTTNYIN
jgi:hypothetical protein